MRIIAGEARGRTLVAPAGQNTRPTQDYVRESLFNILNAWVMDARVLDLFAGTGALSLECISRGAESAVMVDMDRAACVAIKKNIEAVRCGERCRLIQKDYRVAIDLLSRESATFDLVFLDPPYRMTETGEICGKLLDAGLLCRDCMLVIEHRAGQMPVLDERFAVTRVKKYGDTEISFVSCRQEERSASEEER